MASKAPHPLVKETTPHVGLPARAGHGLDRVCAPHTFNGMSPPSDSTPISSSVQSVASHSEASAARISSMGLPIICSRKSSNFSRATRTRAGHGEYLAENYAVVPWLGEVGPIGDADRSGSRRSGL